jgi:hypothetical protein
MTESDEIEVCLINARHAQMGRQESIWPRLRPTSRSGSNSFTSSYGAEKMWPATRPIPDSSTFGPTPFRGTFCQIGATTTFSYMSCWIRCRIASRFFGSSSPACSRKSPSMSA